MAHRNGGRPPTTLKPSRGAAILAKGLRDVFIPHGGGVTPVVQTVYTDLNQAVKARYQALDVAAMIRLIRGGVAVPLVAPSGVRGPHGGGLE